MLHYLITRRLFTGISRYLSDRFTNYDFPFPTWLNETAKEPHQDTTDNTRPLRKCVSIEQRRDQRTFMQKLSTFLSFFFSYGALLSFNHASTVSLGIPTRTFKARRCASSGGYLAVPREKWTRCY